MADELPKSALKKCISNALPEGLKCGEDAHDMISNCCSEFVRMIASEANEICTNANKKTITTSHMLQALQVTFCLSCVSNAHDFEHCRH